MIYPFNPSHKLTDLKRLKRYYRATASSFKIIEAGYGLKLGYVPQRKVAHTREEAG